MSYIKRQYFGPTFAILWGCIWLIACFLVCIARNYEIKAHSDPATWLAMAREFPYAVRANEFPLGYPAYLWLILKLAGPVYVFLANLPLELLLIALIGWISYLAARFTETMVTATATALMAMALALWFCAETWLYLFALYRDPLSHVLLLSAVGMFCLFWRSDGSRPAWLGWCGWLVGCASWVREPAILASLPILIILAVGNRRRSARQRWIAIVWFSLGVAIGILPLLLQAGLVADRLAISPYCLHNQRLLPGLHMAAFKDTGSCAFSQLVGRLGGLLLLGFCLGSGMALLRRNMAVLGLLLPLACGFFLFYSFYWIYVPRYFFLASLWICMVAAFGLARTLCIVIGTETYQRAWHGWALALVSLGFSLAAGVSLLGVWPKEAPFRFPEALAFRRDFERQVPAGSLVIGHGYISLYIQALTHCQAAPLESYLPNGRLSPASTRAALHSLNPGSNAVFYLRWGSIGEFSDIANMMSLSHDLRPVCEFDSAAYGMQRALGAPTLTLFRITSHTLRSPGQ